MNASITYCFTIQISMRTQINVNLDGLQKNITLHAMVHLKTVRSLVLPVGTSVADYLFVAPSFQMLSFPLGTFELRTRTWAEGIPDFLFLMRTTIRSVGAAVSKSAHEWLGHHMSHRIVCSQ